MILKKRKLVLIVNKKFVDTFLKIEWHNSVKTFLFQRRINSKFILITLRELPRIKDAELLVGLHLHPL